LHVREDDTVVVWKLDRLGRTVKGLVDLVNQFETQHVHFKSLTDSIDTTTPAGRFFFHVMASLAQMERELLIERTQAGLAAARRQGRVGGRKRLMTEPKVKAAKKLLAAGTPSREWRRTLGCLCPRCTAGCRPGHATDLRLPTYLLQLLRMGGRPSKDDQRRIVGGTERVSRVVLLSRA
jgi:hypothetical protein